MHIESKYLFDAYTTDYHVFRVFDKNEYSQKKAVGCLIQSIRSCIHPWLIRDIEKIRIFRI